MGVVKGQGHVVSPVSDSLPFRLTSIRPTILEIQVHQNMTFKIQGQGNGWGQRSRSHSSPSIQPMHFLFISCHSDQPFLRWDMGIECLTLKETHLKFRKKSSPKKIVAYRIPPKSNQVMNMTRGILLPRFVVIGWVVLTLSCGQANFSSSMSQLWPWVKVTERSSSTFSQMHNFLSQISKV